ncbi:MAG TPA: hypothetical protein VGQ83_26055 [Polyangia bacterium]|jgi:hypothetical protein
MALQFREMHPAASTDLLNDEWFILENAGQHPLVTQGCTVLRARGKGRGAVVGTLDPGFTLKPGERIRLVTGVAAKKAHGEPPAETDALKNYHLFLKAPLLEGPGTVLRIVLKQLELGQGTFDPAAPGGVAA